MSRKFEKLDNLQIYNNPKNRIEIQQNKESLILAEKIKKIREVEALTRKFNIEEKSNPSPSFLEYFKRLIKERLESKGNYDNWDATYKHLARYCTSKVQFSDIDIDFIKGFK